MDLLGKKKKEAAKKLFPLAEPGEFGLVVKAPKNGADISMALDAFLKAKTGYGLKEMQAWQLVAHNYDERDGSVIADLNQAELEKASGQKFQGSARIDGSQVPVSRAVGM